MLDRSLRSVRGAIINLLDSNLGVKLKLTVVGDTVVGDPIVNAVASFMIQQFISLESVNFEFQHCLLPGVTGNGASMGYCFDLARESTAEQIFFIEDDYIFDPAAFFLMVKAVREISPRISGNQICLTPTDYPNWYFEALAPTYIFLATGRHWRNISSSTATFLLSKVTLEKHWDDISEMRYYGIKPGIGEVNTICKAYQHAPLFSPIPGLAHHYQYKHTLSPLLDDDARYIQFS